MRVADGWMRWAEAGVQVRALGFMIDFLPRER